MVVIAIIMITSFWARNAFYLRSDQYIELVNGCVGCTFRTHSSVVVDDRFGPSGFLLEDRSPSVQNFEQAIWGFSLKTRASRFSRTQTFQFTMPLWPLLLILFLTGGTPKKDRKVKMSSATLNKKPTVQMGWFDEQFTTIGWPMLIALSALFMPLMWIFSGWALLVARNPVARRKARNIFIVLSLNIVVDFFVILYLLSHLKPTGIAA